ncbi:MULTISPECIES: hypothetical protein [Aphanothece]|uniref:hypothetical protein n=1 Tax=Aphanothece TaxID=1121 RepID=UPI00398F5A4B
MANRFFSNPSLQRSLLAPGRAGKPTYPSCPIQLGSRGGAAAQGGSGHNPLTWEELLGQR